MALAACSAAGLLACAADYRGGDDEVESDAATIEGGPARHHAHPPFGPPALVLEALEVPDLTDAQRESIEAALESIKPPERTERASALAAAIRAGSVDKAKLAPSAGEERRMMAEMHDRFTEALATLHRTLRADQRAAVVARVRSQLERVPGSPPPPPSDAEGRGPGPLGFLLHGIEVDDEQRQRIERAITDASLEDPPRPSPRVFAAQRAHMTALLDAFAADGFDPESALPPPGEAPPRPPVLEALEVVVPLLDDAQRAALADKIERGPMHPRRR